MLRSLLRDAGRFSSVVFPILTGAAVVAIAVGFANSANGQGNDRRYERDRYDDPRDPRDPRYNRDEFSDELLKSLVDTEREYRSERRNETNEMRPLNAPLLNRSTPVRPIDSTSLTRIRRALDDFSSESARLTDLLESEMDRLPGLKTHWSDALKIRARSGILAERGKTARDIRELNTDIAGLDRDWRVLSYRLKQTRGLSRSTLQSVQRLDGSADQLNQGLSFGPQLNRTELLRQTTSLSVDLHNLTEDIELEIDDTQLRHDLLSSGRKLQHQARLVATTITDGRNYDEIVAEYKRFKSLWSPYRTELGRVDNRYVERTVRRIRSANQDIHELLWLPHETDHSQLLHLATVLKRDVDEFFVRAPLKLLVGLPHSEQVLPTADQFYGVCEHFADCVNRGEDIETLVEDYEYIVDAWQDFDALFRPINSQAARNVLSEIEHSVHALRDALHITTGTNRRQLMDLAGELENLADHLDILTREWLRKDRPTYRNQALRDVSEFAVNTKRFSQSLADNRVSNSSLYRECSSLFEQWRTVYGHISRCETSERAQLARLAARITPTLVELRTLLAP